MLMSHSKALMTLRIYIFINAINERSMNIFFFSSRRRHTRWPRDWSSDVCSSDLSFRGARSYRRTVPFLSRKPYKAPSSKRTTSRLAGQAELVFVDPSIQSANQALNRCLEYGADTQ